MELKTVLCIKNGAPFKRVETLVGKLRHAAIGIPAGKALFRPINQLMGVKLITLVWLRCPGVKEALSDWRQIIQKVSKEPTHVGELMPGDPDYTGTLDSSSKCAGGIWVYGTQELAPIVWQVIWPAEIRA